jgi:hypothetical protein
MRRFLTAAALFAATLFSLPSIAQDAPRTEIEGVIQNQIDAFLRDDFDAAFTYASPNIKRLFGTSDRFGMMVRQGYPMVWRPSDVRYLDLETIDGRLWQKVMITDAAGAVHVLGYQMIETAEGWQINGVQVLQAPQVGA